MLAAFFLLTRDQHLTNDPALTRVITSQASQQWIRNNEKDSEYNCPGSLKWGLPRASGLGPVSLHRWVPRSGLSWHREREMNPAQDGKLLVHFCWPQDAINLFNFQPLHFENIASLRKKFAILYTIQFGCFCWNFDCTKTMFVGIICFLNLNFG